jgi:tellurite resistance protein
MNLFTDVELTAEQEQLVGRAMLAVARADGSADPREVALIEELAPVDTTAPDLAPAEVTAAFPEGAGRDLLLKSALLVAFVDGDYSAAEKAVVASFAAACSVPDARLDELASTVKDFLMAPLLSLSNSASVVEVSRKLKV